MKRTRRLFLPLIVLVLCASAASAQSSQDAELVLRTSVSYNTLKNSTTMSDEKRAEVARLEKLAQEANAQRRYGDAFKHLNHAMMVLRDQPWTPMEELRLALTVKPNRAIVEPSETIRLQLGQRFSLDEKVDAKLTGSVDLLPMQSNEVLKNLKVIDGLTADFLARPTAIDISIPDMQTGNYQLRLTLKSAGATATTGVSTFIHVERGLAAKIAAARERAAKIEAKLRAAKNDALLAALPSAGYRIHLLEMASASEISIARVNFDSEVKEAGAILDELDAGRDPYATRRGDLRKAYLSKVDTTLQPYRIYVPTTYDGSKAYPLIIALHGMGGDENSYFDQYLQGGFKVEAEKRGYIVACPKGRGTASMYRGAAEQDVMDVLEIVSRTYRVDADRIYLTGHSMGGFGTWSVAINHPQIFAALAPVAGGGNPSAMSTIAHIPQLVVHGDNDKTVSVEQSRAMVAAAKKLGVEVKYLEIPNGDHVTVAGRTFADVYDFFDTHKRKGAEAKAAGAAKGN